MTLEQVRSFYSAEPFRPFVIHLVDGRHVPVHHRDFVMTVPSGRILVVCQPDDTVNFIDLLLVTDLEVKPVAKDAGKRRRQ